MYNVDTKLVSKNFSKAVNFYDDFAIVQKKAAEKLCGLLRDLNFLSILDIGSGTSFIARDLLKVMSCSVFEIDISNEMLNFFSHGKIFKTVADANNIPFISNYFDIVTSSFSLQWCDLDKVFCDVSRVLKNDGYFVFCVPLNDSLKQLRYASKESGCNFYFGDLPSTNDVKSAMLKNNFCEKSFFVENFTVEYQSGIDALISIKKIGASYSYKRENYSVTKSQISKFNDIYAKNFFSTHSDGVFLGWSVAFLICKKYV